MADHFAGAAGDGRGPRLAAGRALSRRALLGAVAGGAATACSRSGSDGRARSASGPPDGGGGQRSPSGGGHQGSLPARHPLASVVPDLPGGDGALPGYFHYPTNPATYIDGTIGRGGAVTALLQGDVSVGADGNRWLQALNEKMAVDLRLTQVQAQDYAAKLAVTLAGNDLPDMVQMVPMPNMRQVLDKVATNLTEYLAGDKVARYPGLAALPSTAWTAGLIDGQIYGIAQPRATAGSAVLTRQSILDELGVSDGPQSGGDYLDLCEEITASRTSRWAFGIKPQTWLLAMVLEMMEAPNGWSVDDGQFTSAYESSRYPDALDAVHKMWKSGYIHPDSFTASGGAYLSWWLAGTTVLYPQAFDWWCGYQKLYPDMPVGAVAPPKWEGGGDARKALSAGHYAAYVSLKKASAARVEELLRVWDYLAAPFGTQEFLEVNYGVRGHDYTLDHGDPVVTKRSSSEYMQGLVYVGSTGFSVLYVPGNESIVKDASDYLKRVVPGGVADPTVGLFSETELEKGPAAKKYATDIAADIIQGRKSVHAWADAVKKWKRDAGDAIKSEYEASYAVNRT